jgi:hypothetical protein
MVRMLFDPRFAERALRDPEGALADVELSDRERAWLRAPDPRGWRTDPERPDRALTVLVQEYPASVALAAASGGGLEKLRVFFSSAGFHRAIQDRGSMALAFGGYLIDLAEAGEVGDRRVAPLARLERTIVRLRRCAGPKPPPANPEAEAFRLSPDKMLDEAEAGTADLHDEVHRSLAASGSDLARVVFQPPSPLPGEETDPTRREPLLLELVRDEGPRVKYMVGIAEITEELHALLARATAPRPWNELVAEAIRLGADPDDASEILSGLLADGTLVPSQGPEGGVS